METQSFFSTKLPQYPQQELYPSDMSLEESLWEIWSPQEETLKGSNLEIL